MKYLFYRKQFHFFKYIKINLFIFTNKFHNKNDFITCDFSVFSNRDTMSPPSPFLEERRSHLYCDSRKR